MHERSASDRTMLHWLSLALREARQGSGVSATRIAADLGVSETTVNRFERGEAWPARGAVRVDDYLAAYAHYLLSSGDARDYWAAAIDRWRREGLPPLALSASGVLLPAPPGELGRLAQEQPSTGADRGRSRSGPGTGRGARRGSA